MTGLGILIGLFVLGEAIKEAVKIYVKSAQENKEKKG